MHCYRCGAALKDDERHLRRSVATGGWVSRAYPGPRVREARTRHGRRVVCRRCARLIDLSEGRLELAENAKLAMALAALFLVALLSWLRHAHA